MVYLVAAVLLLFCAPAFFAEARMIKWMAGFGGFSIILGGLACSWPSFMPANFMAEHPSLAGTPLQPEMAMLVGGVLILFGLCLFMVLGCRMVYSYFRVVK